MLCDLQMVELPHDAEGLSWIVNREPLHLLLIPGLQPASIAAAAAGDQEALSYLRFVAQYSAAHRGMLDPSKLDSCCLQAAELRPEDSDEEFLFGDHLTETSDDVYQAFFHRQNFTEQLLKDAVQEGQLAAFPWIRALCHRIYGDDEDLMEIAASQGSLGFMKFLRSGPRPAPWNDNVALAALDHPPCLQWLLSQPDHPWPNDLIEQAASDGSLEALEVLHVRNLPAFMWGPGVCENAVACRDPILVLQWLRARDPPVPWSEATCSAAARQGNLGLLQWLRVQSPPCPWSSAVTAPAAGRNDLSMLQWCRAQTPPCPWDQGCSEAAAAAGNVGVLQWLQAQAPPCPTSRRCTSLAAKNGHLEALQCLVAQSCCPLARGCVGSAASNGDLPMLQWLHSQQCPLHGSLYLRAARDCHTHIIRWLHIQGVPAPPAPESAVKAQSAASAMQGTSTPILLFLGDIKCCMDTGIKRHLDLARKTLCTFYGLLRWCRRAVSDPSKGMHRAFNELATSTSGQTLLVRLSLLPSELIDRIAVAAELQHDLAT